MLNSNIQGWIGRMVKDGKKIRGKSILKELYPLTIKDLKNSSSIEVEEVILARKRRNK